MAPNAVITGGGMYAPSRVMTNDDLAKIVDTSDEWIVSRTGIRERRIAADDENTTILSVHASRDALAGARPGPRRARPRRPRALRAGLPAGGNLGHGRHRAGGDACRWLRPPGCLLGL